MRGRRVAVGALLVVGTLFWTVFGLGLWAQRQALDTDAWVETSGDLLENEQIRDALALFLVERLYQDADVQERIERALPPELDRLAAPAAAGLKEVARRSAPRLLGSAVALNAWRDANRETHETLLAVVRGEAAERDVTLDLGELLRHVAAGTGLPPDAVDRLPPDLARLQVARPEQLDAAKSALDLFEEIPWILFGLALLAFAGAIALSAGRRRGALNVGLALVVAGVALLAVRRLAGRALVDALADAPNAGDAAGDAWGISTSLLVDAAQGSILLGLLIASASWLAGPARHAIAARRLATPVLRDHPGAARAGLGVAILLLVLWGPVPWTTRLIPVLVFAVAAFLWLEWMRRAPQEPAPA